MKIENDRKILWFRFFLSLLNYDMLLEQTFVVDFYLWQRVSGLNEYILLI